MCKNMNLTNATFSEIALIKVLLYERCTEGLKPDRSKEILFINNFVTTKFQINDYFLNGRL